MDDASRSEDLAAEARAELDRASDRDDEARLKVLDELYQRLEAGLDEDGSPGR